MTELEQVETMLRRAKVSYVKETPETTGLQIIVIVVTGSTQGDGGTTDWRFNLDGSLRTVEQWSDQ